MKCIAKFATQAIDDGGHIRTFRKGEVFDFKKCPVNFESLESAELDFEQATKDQLMDAEWDRKEIVDFAEEFYDKDISRFRKKESIVDAFIDARYRYINLDDLK